MSKEELRKWIGTLDNSKNTQSKNLVDYFHTVLNETKNHNKVYVVFDNYEFDNFLLEGSNAKIYGMYTLSISTINIEELSSGQRRKHLGGSAYKGINSCKEIPTLLLGKVVKNDMSENNEFFYYIFKFLKEQIRILDSVASLKYASLDCKPELYEKVYSKYGFKKINEKEQYIACAMKIID